MYFFFPFKRYIFIGLENFRIHTLLISSKPTVGRFDKHADIPKQIPLSKN